MTNPRIEDIRRMTDAELDAMAWHAGPVHAPPVVLELSNGDVVFPSQDPEGNGPGALFGLTEDGDLFAFDPDDE